MNRMKRNRAFLIFATILFVIIPINNSQAGGEEKVGFKVESSSVENEKEITIKVDMENSANFVAANWELEYDTTKLEYVSSEKGAVLKTGMMALINNDSATGKISIAYVGESSTTDFTKQAGNVLTVTFKTKPDVEGTANLNLSCTILKQKDGTSLTPNITQGSIAIVKKDVSTTTQDSLNQKEENTTIVDNENEKLEHTTIDDMGKSERLENHTSTDLRNSKEKVVDVNREESNLEETTIRKDKVELKENEKIIVVYLTLTIVTSTVIVFVVIKRGEKNYK